MVQKDTYRNILTVSTLLGTQATIKSSLVKIYGNLDDITVKTRKREDIVRSRFEKERDKRFSEENNKDLITFLKATGLRRREAESITVDNLKYIYGKPFLWVIGKGGKYREVPITERFVKEKLHVTRQSVRARLGIFVLMFNAV